MLSFGVKSGRTIQIYCDEGGISTLIDVLSNLRKNGHTHLRAPPGGTELSSKSPFGEDAMIEVISLGAETKPSHGIEAPHTGGENGEATHEC
jgi:hypothetical protein